MTILKIIQYPDARLHSKAAAVTTFDQELRTLVANMAETMYAAPGVGLAATQVDVKKRVIVIDISEAKNDLLTLINPQITAQAGSKLHEEGCLSVPGIYENVTRAEKISVKAQDMDGKYFKFDAEGLLAVCVQHEIDHLEGRVFVEYLSRLKQTRIANKMRKLRRETM